MPLLDTLKEYEPAIQVAGLVLLARYVWDTSRIKWASLRQTESLFQPCLVLEASLRPAKDQIVDNADGPASATQLRDPVVCRNIGTGPAVAILFAFSGLNKDFQFLAPHIDINGRFELPLGHNTLSRGKIAFVATYKSVGGTVFQSRQEITDGAFKAFRMKRASLYARLRARSAERTNA